MDTIQGELKAHLDHPFGQLHRHDVERQNRPKFCQKQPHQHQQMYEYDEPEVHRSHYKLFVSEFIGTFVFIYLSQSAITSFELAGTQNDTINRQTVTILSSGLAFLLASLLTLNISGAHLNPAYTFTRALYGYTAWGHAINYLLAQYLGSFFAAIFLHATHSYKLLQRHYEGSLLGPNITYRAHGHILSTGKFFSSYPPTDVPMAQLSISYILAVAHLMLLIIAIHESKLFRLPRYIRPFYLACALVTIQAAFHANGGPVLNPAQDFSPRLYISLSGWGHAAFNLYHYKYWWICGVVMPHFGAIIGFGVYQIIIHVEKTRRRESSRGLEMEGNRLTHDSLDH